MVDRISESLHISNVFHPLPSYLIICLIEQRNLSSKSFPFRTKKTIRHLLASSVANDTSLDYFKSILIFQKEPFCILGFLKCPQSVCLSLGVVHDTQELNRLFQSEHFCSFNLESPQSQFCIIPSHSDWFIPINHILDLIISLQVFCYFLLYILSLFVVWFSILVIQRNRIISLYFNLYF